MISLPPFSCNTTHQSSSTVITCCHTAPLEEPPALQTCLGPTSGIYFLHPQRSHYPFDGKRIWRAQPWALSSASIHHPMTHIPSPLSPALPARHQPSFVLFLCTGIKQKIIRGEELLTQPRETTASKQHPVCHETWAWQHCSPVGLATRPVQLRNTDSFLHTQHTRVPDPQTQPPDPQTQPPDPQT